MPSPKAVCRSTLPTWRIMLSVMWCCCEPTDTALGHHHLGWTHRGNLLPPGCLHVRLQCVSMGVEIWRSIAKRQQWWLLLRRNVMVMGVMAISRE